MYIQREIESTLKESLVNYPVVALLGARQTGKSTLVKHILESVSESIYLDLERPSDLNKLADAEWFFSTQKNKLICIDEIQRKPELFPIIRSLVDEWNREGAFLILGSASRDLLQQSSESLAGRIVYKKLTPFLWKEINHFQPVETYFSTGGFPRSFLAKDPKISYEWRENFISTFLERDLQQWRGFTPVTMRRLWLMLAHNNGQTADFSNLARALGISSVTVRNYIDLLEETFMLDVVKPYISNLGKRLVKSPKIYVSDSGITAALLGLDSYEKMTGHSFFSSVWEQIVLSNLKGHFPQAEFYFYRTSNGSEIDFVMTHTHKVFAVECKASLSPTLSKGNYNAIQDINPTKTYVVVPAKKGWVMKENIEVVSLSELVDKLKESNS